MEGSQLPDSQTAAYGGHGSPALPRGPLRTAGGYAVAALAIWLAAGALGVLAARAPSPVGADAPGDAVSAERAFEVLGRLARDEDGRASAPRPVGSRANGACRARILDELRRLGMEPSVQETFGSYPRQAAAGPDRTVVARLRGEGGLVGERQAILCMAHYDSVAAGPGIGDDLAGVAAWLEVARALRADQPLMRDVIFLFEDGEEQGLLGAEVFASQHPWAKDVGAVVNLEGRGTRGPSRMFETGADNAWIVKAFAKHAREPSASSISTEIYRRMPNDTDYTVWRERGIPGLNFAFIGGASSYHTPLDDLESLSHASLQHHAQNGLDAVRALDAASIPSAPGLARGDAVFFDWPGLGLVAFSYSLSRGLGVFAMALSFLVAALWLRRREVRMRGVLCAFVFLLASVTAALGAGYGSRFALEALGVTAISNLARPGFVVAATVGGAMLGSTLVAWAFGRWLASVEVAVAVGIALGLGAMALGFSVTGGVHLLLLPSLALGLTMLFCAGIKSRTLATGLATLAALAVTGVLWTPLHLAVVDAFGTGSGAVICAPLTVPVMLLSIPMAGRSPSVPWLGLGAALLGMASGALGTYFPIYSPLSPAHVDVVLRSEAGQSHVRLRGSKSAQNWFRRDAAGDFEREVFAEEAGGETRLEILEHGSLENRRPYVRLRVNAQKKSDVLRLSAIGAEAMSIDGHPGLASGTWILGPSPKGHEILLELTEGASVQIQSADTRFGLHGAQWARFVRRWLEARPNDTVPSQNGDRYELLTAWRIQSEHPIGKVREEAR